MRKKKTIGIELKIPEKECNDKKCPFHSDLKVRGRVFTGRVISSKAHKMVTIEIPRTSFIKKYERYEKKRTRIHAHNPECINVKEEDIVKIVECRPLSKIKNFVVVERIK